MDILIEPGRHVSKHACLCSYTHGQHDTHHKQDLLVGAILQGPWNQALRHLVGIHQLAVHQLIDHP